MGKPARARLGASAIGPDSGPTGERSTAELEVGDQSGGHEPIMQPIVDAVRGVAPDRTPTLREARAQFERQWILATLELHQGRVGDAAKALGIQRTNLYRKVRQLKLPLR